MSLHELSCLKSLLKSGLNVDDILFVFFNSILREEIAFDFLFNGIVEAGIYSEEELIKHLSNY